MSLKNNLLVYVHYPHGGECATALHVIISSFFQNCYFTACFGTDLLKVMERSKDITHVTLLPKAPRLVAKILDIFECKRQ